MLEFHNLDCITPCRQERYSVNTCRTLIIGKIIMHKKMLEYHLSSNPKLFSLNAPNILFFSALNLMVNNLLMKPLVWN